LIQEYLRGQELGVDVYVDWLTHEVTDIFIKEKLVMRAGETDKSRSVKRDDVFELVEQVLRGTGLVGPLDFDLFDVDGTLYLSEINPRFGGDIHMRMNAALIFRKRSETICREDVIPDASGHMRKTSIY